MYIILLPQSEAYLGNPHHELKLLYGSSPGCYKSAFMLLRGCGCVRCLARDDDLVLYRPKTISIAIPYHLSHLDLQPLACTFTLCYRRRVPLQDLR